jgi:hypothetical protein
MRRLAAVLALALAVPACATPAVRLEPRFPLGEVRSYRLVVDAVTRIEVPGLAGTDRTRLIAIARIEVTRASAEGATLAVRLTPTRLERNGSPVSTPQPQDAVVEVGPDGALRSVSSVGGLPAAPGGVEEIAPLLDAGFPAGRRHVGSRWRRELGDGRGSQSGRVAALRVTGGERTAIVALATRRDLQVERPVAGANLTLEGTETAAGEVAFAFDRGYAVRVSSEGEARLKVGGGKSTPGGVVIVTNAEMTLLRVSGS